MGRGGKREIERERGELGKCMNERREMTKGRR